MRGRPVGVISLAAGVGGLHPHQRWAETTLGISPVKAVSVGASFISNQTSDVHYWHLADIPAAPKFVRYGTRTDKSPAYDHFELIMGLTEFAERHFQPGQAIWECPLLVQQWTAVDLAATADASGAEANGNSRQNLGSVKLII